MPTNLLRVRAAFSGWPAGGPGVSTHFFDSENGVVNDAVAQLAADRVRDSLIAARNLFFAGFTWSVSSTVDEIDPTNGNVVQTRGVTGSTGVGGSGTGWGPTPIGLLVRFETDTFIVGRRLRGRTFLSPVDVSMLEGDGTPSGTAIAHANSFGTSMRDEGIGAARQVIWHRPTPGGTNGQYGVVQSHIVPNKYAVLRSRRD